MVVLHDAPAGTPTHLMLSDSGNPPSPCTGSGRPNDYVRLAETSTGNATSFRLSQPIPASYAGLTQQLPLFVMSNLFTLARSVPLTWRVTVPTSALQWGVEVDLTGTPGALSLGAFTTPSCYTPATPAARWPLPQPWATPLSPPRQSRSRAWPQQPLPLPSTPFPGAAWRPAWLPQQ